ncbi:MAG: LLM class oxidoreductase [Pseudomonadota bacterium]
MAISVSKTRAPDFASLNRGYNAVFSEDGLTLGLVVPIEAYPNTAVPTMQQHIERVQQAEALGFSAVWLRDVPFNVPSFGDAGQMFDPFVYLGALATTTEQIALGVSSIILPLRHPAHVAKAAASADVLSDGRILLGIASGDRFQEYPALDVNFELRGARFREAYTYIRSMADSMPQIDSAYGQVGGGMDLLPKPTNGRLPLLVTGSSQQSPEWIAAHADGWMTYPRPALAQARLIEGYRRNVAEHCEYGKPVMEPLYIDLVEDAGATPTPIHLGLRLGVDGLRDYLESRQAIGVNHVALNLRFNQQDIEQTLDTLANEILPHFNNRKSQ